MPDPLWCGLVNFITVFCFFGINFIASEIEMPFGDDPNDLPLHSLQSSLNASLIQLLEKDMATCPDFQLTEARLDCPTLPCPLYLMSAEQHTLFWRGAKGTTDSSPTVGLGSLRKRMSFLLGKGKKTREDRLHEKRKSGTRRGKVTGRQSLQSLARSMENQNPLASESIENTKGDVSDDVTDTAEEDRSRLESLTTMTNLLKDDARKKLEGQLLEHSARMEKHFSKISIILDDHLSFVVQDLDVIFAGCKAKSVPLLQKSETAPGRCQGDQASSCARESTLAELVATGMSVEEVTAWVSATFREESRTIGADAVGEV